MSKETKIILIISAMFVAVFIGFIYLATKPNSVNQSQPTVVDPNLLVRKDSYQTSPTNGKITLVEFGDFQCPACGEAHPIIKEILKNYGDKVNFVFRNFPLSQHTNALPAAETAEAAGAQGKYWEMYDKLYENQDKWSSSTNVINIFVGYAKDLGLDVDKFTQDVKGEKYKDRITQDENDGNVIAIDSTPTFFVDGQKMIGVPTLDELKSLIDQKLAAK